MDGGLNMISISEFFNSLSANWVTRIQNADPHNDGWAQLPSIYLDKLETNGTLPLYNFDDTVIFPELDRLFKRRLFKTLIKHL